MFQDLTFVIAGELWKDIGKQRSVAQCTLNANHSSKASQSWL